MKEYMYEGSRGNFDERIDMESRKLRWDDTHALWHG